MSNTHTHTHTNTCIYTHIHTYTHTHTHTHTHTQLANKNDLKCTLRENVLFFSQMKLTNEANSEKKWS